jgi:ribulose-5-phosphate 4-epimerase/fuculose-1-phosphate aldolase
MSIKPPKDEAEARIQLAAVYRLVAHFGLDDMVYTHISARVPGPDHHFLINPYGLFFNEITASSLVKIDYDGNIVEPTPYEVNRTGFVIHSAIHMARPDVFCVLHIHSRSGVALSALEEGLLPLNQTALQFYNRIGYHDYEGLALDLSERERLVRDLGHNDVMILRNHGLLSVGRSMPEAFNRAYYLDQACRYQLDVLATGRPVTLLSHSVSEFTARQFVDEFERTGVLEWAGLIRRLDALDPSYKS